MKHFVNRSGGTGSWYTGRRVLDLALPGDEVHFVFADTSMEDEDLYRFLREVKGKDKKYAKARGVKPVFHYLKDGRTPWDVFFDVKYLGNTRIDPCSKVLKRDPIRKFLEDNFDPADTICYIGIDWSEEHRFTKAKPYWAPFEVRAPLTEPPFVDKEHINKLLEAEGVAIPRLYGMGFAHNNCSGFCVKGGHGSFKILLEKKPDEYLVHEEREQEFNRQFRQGKDPVTILRDRSRDIIMQRLGLTTDDVEKRVVGQRTLTSGRVLDKHEWFVSSTGEPLPTQLPLSLRDLRLRIETGVIAVDEFDLGGCACFTPDFGNDIDTNDSEEVA